MKYHYDASAEVCPVPLIKMKLQLRKMSPGDSLTMLITDEGSKKDIPALLADLSYSYTQKPLTPLLTEIIISCE